MLRQVVHRFIPFVLCCLFVAPSSFFIACGGGEVCTKNADCVDHPDYGKGYACIKKDGVRACVQSCPSACQKDADCGLCIGGKNYCVGGVCTYQAEQCPASCTQDSECSKCENGRNSCSNGVCKAPEPTCPTSCTQDSECSKCEDNKVHCLQGACSTKQAPKCPDSCTRDSDCDACSDGKTSCVGAVCAKEPSCPSSCTQDSDCAKCSNNKTSCVNSICAEKTTPTCPSSCSQDSDCAKCSGNKTSCVNNICAEKTTPTCPSSCSQDSDCAKCSNNKTSCVNNVCAEKIVPACPASCSQDADCAKCPDDKTSCSNSVCAKKAGPTCPAVCRKDSDCSPCPTGKQFCVAGVCDAKPVCPSSCSKNSDCSACPVGKQSCVAGVCGGTTTCPSSCSVHSDCAKCTGNKIACVGGVCSKPVTCPASCSSDAQCIACGGHYGCRQSKCQLKLPPSSGPGQTCSSSKPCKTGELCIEADGVSTCFQDCSSKPSACTSNTDGRTACRPFARDSSGNVISVCLGVSKKGGACGYSFLQQADCQGGLNPPLYCAANKTCKEGVLQTKAGDPCNTSTDQSDPRKLCDRSKQLVCDEKTGKCAGITHAKEGEECDASGQVLGKIIICDPNVAGLTCIQFSSTEKISRCHRTCTPSASNQCSHKTGLSCEPLLSGGRGLCMDKVCTKNSDCVFANYVCAPRQTGGNMCFPPIPDGPKTFGQVCGSPSRTEGCKKNLDCLRFLQSKKGYCSPDCTAAGSTCPTLGGIASVCRQVFSNGDKACIFPCGAPGQVCPSGLTCSSRLNICIGPHTP